MSTPLALKVRPRSERSKPALGRNAETGVADSRDERRVIALRSFAAGRLDRVEASRRESGADARALDDQADFEWMPERMPGASRGIGGWLHRRQMRLRASSRQRMWTVALVLLATIVAGVTAFALMTARYRLDRPEIGLSRPEVHAAIKRE